MIDFYPKKYPCHEIAEHVIKTTHPHLSMTPETLHFIAEQSSKFTQELIFEQINSLINLTDGWKEFISEIKKLEKKWSRNRRCNKVIK